MKVASIIYHKNITSIYQEDWIKQSFESIINQTFSDFIILEMNYGDDVLNICQKYSDIRSGKEFIYYNIKKENHAEAMNFLLEKCSALGVDVVFNNNLDDYNDLNRYQIQLNKINEGYDIVSSNFIHVDSKGSLIRKMGMDKYDIKKEFDKGHNVIAHPSVCYSGNFIKNNRYESSDIPEEDFKLWKRTIDDYKFFVCPEYLLNYRIHSGQITYNPEILPKKQENVEIIFHEVGNNFINRNETCACGEPKNKVRYNFCPKCNRLY